MKCTKTIVLLMLLTVLVVSINGQSPVFLVHPVSTAAIDGTTVQFTCTANESVEILYRVNGTTLTSLAVDSFRSMGFEQLSPDTLDVSSMTIQRNLSVTVSSQYNNTDIQCRASGPEMGDVVPIRSSDIADLIIQGPLSSVGDLSDAYYIDSTSARISWSPPFTLPGTNITGYNISVTSNGTVTINYFTSNTYFVLLLTDITNSSCDEISITVSGYNGLNGDNNTVPVVSSMLTLLPTVSVRDDLSLSILLNISNFCFGRFSSIVLLKLVDETVNLTVPSNITRDIWNVTDVYTVEEDQFYTLSVSFNVLDVLNLDASSISFNTYGVRSIEVPSNMTIRCYFNTFSSDTGCTVQLLQSGDIKYTMDLTNRTDDIAEGTIDNVVTGIYNITATDLNSNVVVALLVNVPLVRAVPSTSSSSTATFTSSMTIPMATSTSPSTTTTTTGTTSPSVAGSTDLTVVWIAIPIGIVILILSVVVVILCVCCVCKMCKQDNSDDPKRSRGGSADAFIHGSEFDGRSPTSTVPPTTIPLTGPPTHTEAELENMYAKPDKRSHNPNANLVYADLTIVQQQSKQNNNFGNTPPTDKKSNDNVVYSDLIIKGQPPPPPYEPTNPHLTSSVTVIPSSAPRKLMVEHKGGEIVEFFFNHPDSDNDDNRVAETSLSHDNNRGRGEDNPHRPPPPPPHERAPSPPTGNETPPVPPRHGYTHLDSNDEYTDESYHPELAEIRTEHKHGVMNTPTATFL